ncbi:helix-turn-helix transcriptional regulator [Endothiovibrio diazotrophicus]
MDVKTLTLGVLCLGEASGYEIKKRFEDAFQHFFAAGFGSIYPALKKAEEEGLVTCTEVPQEGRPDKKVYRITAAGRAAFAAELAATSPEHKVRSEFLVLIYFAHLLPPARLAEVLEERQRGFEEMRRMVEGCDVECPEAGELTPALRFVAGYATAVFGAAIDYIDAHKGELVDAIKEGSSR